MRTLQMIWAILFPLLLLVIVTVYGLTFWAIGKSRDRTECYHHAKQASDCEQPGVLESIIRRATE